MFIIFTINLNYTCLWHLAWMVCMHAFCAFELSGLDQFRYQSHNGRFYFRSLWCRLLFSIGLVIAQSCVVSEYVYSLLLSLGVFSHISGFIHFYLQMHKYLVDLLQAHLNLDIYHLAVFNQSKSHLVSNKSCNIKFVSLWIFCYIKIAFYMVCCIPEKISYTHWWTC